MSASRGNAISAYNPAFAKGALIYGANIQSGVVTSAHIADGTVVAADVAAGSITSAKLGAAAVVAAAIGAGAVTSAKIGTAAVTNAKMKAAFLSGTLVSGKTVTAIAHGLGVKPKCVVACGIVTRTQASGATPSVVNVAVSAATSTNIYLIASGPINAATKYAAYVQI